MGSGRIIAVANQKGGVGKTTTAINIAASLTVLGKSVLLCDMDPQGNASSGVGWEEKPGLPTLYDALVGDSDTTETIFKTNFAKLSLLPSTSDMAGATIELVSLENRESRLKDVLSPLKGNYDYILIDAPPSLDLLTLNCLAAADTVLVPLQCEFFALDGLSKLVGTIRTVKKSINPELGIEGILFTMYDGRTNLAQKVVTEVKKYFPKDILKTVIPRTVRLSEAPSFGMPVYYYDRNSKGSTAYIAAAQEILKRKGE